MTIFTPPGFFLTDLVRNVSIPKLTSLAKGAILSAGQTGAGVDRGEADGASATVGAGGQVWEWWGGWEGEVKQVQLCWILQRPD